MQQQEGGRGAAGAQDAPDNRPGLAPWSSSCLLSLASMGAGEPNSERQTSRAPLQSHSRFLKQKTSGGPDSLGAGQAELHRAPKPSPSATSQVRTSTVLRKLAQIESKIQRRKARLGTGSSAGLHMQTDEEFFWSKSSDDHEEETGRLRYLKTDAKPEETPMPGTGQRRNTPLGCRADKEKEDTGCLQDAAGEYERQNSISQSRSGGKPFLYNQLNVPARTTSPSSKRSSPPDRSSLKRLLHRAPSPPSRDTPVHSEGTSPSLSSSINDSLAGKASPKVNGRSLSEGSVIRSLDELFSVPGDGQGSSSSGFQVNVLSLANLAPSTASQKEGLPEEATVMETSGSLSMELEQKLFSADTQSAFKPPNSTVEKAVALEEDPGETEISEQLSGSSVEHSSGEQENPTSALYSEDFEPLSEDTGRQSSPKDSRVGSDASPQAGLSDLSSPCLPLVGTRRAPSARRVMTKEAAVQTDGFSLVPHGLKSAAATIDWVPASHVVSMDALKELTTYRPAASALNDMLKQNLLFIQQFVEASHHLHLSFVALLEEEEFHYHTLEEAKMYIDHHKRPTLTLEQALHELEEQQKQV